MVTGPNPLPVPVAIRVVEVFRRGSSPYTTQIFLRFDRDLDDRAARNLGNYVLVGAGRDGRLGTRDDRRIKLIAATYNAETRTVKLIPEHLLSTSRAYEMTAHATGLVGVKGALLDGNGDGVTGDDFVVRVRRSGPGKLLHRQSAAAKFVVSRSHPVVKAARHVAAARAFRPR